MHFDVTPNFRSLFVASDDIILGWGLEVYLGYPLLGCYCQPGGVASPCN